MSEPVLPETPVPETPVVPEEYARLKQLAEEVRLLRLRVAMNEAADQKYVKDPTLRDTFAASIVGGLILREPFSYVRGLVESGAVYELADALMVARTKSR